MPIVSKQTAVKVIGLEWKCSIVLRSRSIHDRDFNLLLWEKKAFLVQVDNVILTKVCIRSNTLIVMHLLYKLCK